MRIANFSNNQFVDNGVLDNAESLTLTSLMDIAGQLHTPGLISASSLVFSYSGLNITVAAPLPFMALFSGGTLSSANGTVDGSTSDSATVDFSSLVPASGSVTAYLVATSGTVMQEPYQVIGPPVGHPDFSPSFAPYTAYAEEQDTIIFSATLTEPNNTDTLFIASTILSAGQTTITTSSTVGQLNAGSILSQDVSIVNNLTVGSEITSNSAFVNSSDSSSNVLIQPEPENFDYAANYGLVNSYYKSLGTANGLTFNGRFYTSIPAGTFQGGIWSVLGTVNYNGTSTTGGMSCVGVYGQGVRNTYSSNSGGNTNPEIWGGVMEGRDLTNQPSLGTNATLGLEVDIYSNNVDNAQEPNIRKGLIVVNNEAIAVASGGYPAEVRVGIGTTTSSTSQFKKILDLTGNYQLAAIDLRGAYSNGQASGSLPKVATTLSAPSTTLSVTNVLPFTSDHNGTDLNTGSHTLSVYVSGNKYTATGYAFTGNGPGGTLTLSTDVSVADGTAGNTVVRNSAAIWLPTNVPIYLDEAESAQLFSNGTGVTTLTNSLAINNATSSNQAVALNQVAQVSPSTASSAIASPAANTTYNVSVSFTAPTSGWVVGFANINTGNTVATTLNLIINGTLIMDDATAGAISLMGYVSVTAGEAMTIESQYVTGATAPSTSFDLRAAAFFISNP